MARVFPIFRTLVVCLADEPTIIGFDLEIIFLPYFCVLLVLMMLLLLLLLLLLTQTQVDNSFANLLSSITYRSPLVFSKTGL